MKKALELVIKLKELNDQYGWQSCFDVPQKYEEMEEVADAIQNELSDIDGFRRKDVIDVLEAIAWDVSNGNYDLDDIELSYYDQDDFIETYILEGMDESARKMFDSLFYFMDSDHRNKWIENNYLLGDSNAYTNKWIDFVIMVQE